MARKVIALALVLVMVACGSCFAARKKAAKVSFPARNIPHASSLPAAENPVEADLAKGWLHMSFKGAFRGVSELGGLTDWVYLAFIARPQKDMYLAVGQSEVFDSKGLRYKYHAVPKIGGEQVFGREVIGGVFIPVLVGLYMPVGEAGEFPEISRVTVSFSKEALEFRSLQVEEWPVWEEIAEEVQ